MAGLRSALTLSLVALCGCPHGPGTDGGAPPDDGGSDAGLVDAGRPAFDAGLPDAGWSSVAIADWCADEALAQCGRDVRCLRVGASRLADCLSRRQAGCDQDAYTSAVRGGRLQYLPTQAATCLNDYAWGSCEDTPGSCTGVFVGMVDPDGGCLLPEECTGAGFCTVYDGLCPHRCHSWTPRSQNCDWSSARCDPATDVCDVDGGAYQCRAFLTEGASCTGYYSCGPGLTCVASQCVRVQAGPQEACGLTQGYPTCGAEYFCRQAYSASGNPPPGVCERKSGLGGTCAGWNDCLPSLHCSNEITTGTCIPKGSPGVGCSNYTDCEDGLYCSDLSLKCTPLPKDGGDCGSTGSFFQCAVGYMCAYSSTDSSWSCQGRRALGEPCTYDSMCQSQQCDFGTLDDGGYGGQCGLPCAQRADAGL